MVCRYVFSNIYLNSYVGVLSVFFYHAISSGGERPGRHPEFVITGLFVGLRKCVMTLLKTKNYVEMRMNRTNEVFILFSLSCNDPN
jgi:hypothetical protein